MENFEWFLTQVMLLGRNPEFNFWTWQNLIGKLRERSGAKLILRKDCGCLINLRAMSDTVYDTTWAKNIPSVQ